MGAERARNREGRRMEGRDKGYNRRAEKQRVYREAIFCSLGPL